MCSFDTDNTCSVWHETRPVARIEHRCGECGRTISPGETYLRVRYVDEFAPGTAKTCAHCSAAAEWLRVVCSGWVLNAIHSDLAEHLSDYGRGQPPRSSHLTRLVRYAERRWRRRDGELIPVETVRAWVDAALARVPEQMRGAA